MCVALIETADLTSITPVFIPIDALGVYFKNELVRGAFIRERRLSEKGVYSKILYYNLKNTKYPHNFTQMLTQCSKI